MCVCVYTYTTIHFIILDLTRSRNHLLDIPLKKRTLIIQFNYGYEV